MGLFSLFGINKKTALKQKELDLLNKLSFNIELMSELKKWTQNELKQVPAIDQETGEFISDKYYDGIFSETSGQEAVEFVLDNKTKFKENDYLIFVLETINDKKNVAVIKGTDELDILRYRRTDGINYDLENKDIVQKISEWKSKYGLSVIGCSIDWLQIKFDNLPNDLDAFVKEVIEFCPDSVDQGVCTIENLNEVIEDTNGLYLWWD